MRRRRRATSLACGGSPAGRDARRGWLAAVSTVAGAMGFVGLLIAARYMPDQATALRAAALVWFVGLGSIRLFFGAVTPRRDGDETRARR